MSEESPVKITNATKTKDPRRVEAGKRLALISKEAKKRKADAAYASEENESEATSTDLKEIGLAVTVLVVVAGAVGLYRKFGKKDEPEKRSEATHQNETPSTSSGVVHNGPERRETKPKTKLDTLD